MKLFYLAVAALPAALLGKQGFIQDISSGKFLTCGSTSCEWLPTPTQIFRQDPGEGTDQYQWHILKANGEDTHQCLDRQYCYWYWSPLRMGACSHCGAKHWQYDESRSRLGEDYFRNCVQSSGLLERCSVAHAPIKWPVSAECKVKSQSVSNVLCRNKNIDGTCTATFSYKPGAGLLANSVGDCNACNSAAGSIKQCNFTMSMNATHTYTVAFHQGSSIEVQAGLQFKPGITFSSSGTGFEVHIDETVSVGHATSNMKFYKTPSNCIAKVKAGTRQDASAHFFGGIYFGDFTADVTTSWDCSWKPDHKETITGTITISDVPQKTMVPGSCTRRDKPCDHLKPLAIQV